MNHMTGGDIKSCRNSFFSMALTLASGEELVYIMDARYIEKGVETSRWEVGVKNKWRWGWIEETGTDGKPHGSWCQKLKEPGACFCVPCSRKVMYGSSGVKVLNRHASDPDHIASVRAVSHTSTLPGATATGTTATSMTERVCVNRRAEHSPVHKIFSGTGFFPALSPGNV